MAHEPKYLVKTHDVEKVLRPRFNCSSTFPKGSFFNYVDHILPIINQLLPIAIGEGILLLL